MIRKKTVFMGGMGVLFLGVIIAISVLKFGNAVGTSEVDWFTRSPSVVKEQDYSTTPSTSVENCTPTNVQIPGVSGFQTLCMTPTAMGLMSQIYSNWGYAQPQSWTKAYNIDYRQGGNPIIQPVPNQASGVYYNAGGVGETITLGLFYQISNHIKFEGIPPFLSYKFGSGMSAPDMIFKHPNGESVQFRYANDFFNFSSNGRYMIARSNQGFMRLNVMNPSIQFFAPYNASGATSYAAINESGRYAVISYLPTDTKLQYVNIIDIDSCSVAVPATTATPPPSYDSCKKINVLPVIKQALPNIEVIYKPQCVNDRTITFIARSKDASGTLKYAQYSMTADGQMRSLKYYEAVGDSYISGEGTFNYRQGTDSERNQCHQSLASYPYLLGGRQKSFASVACSGAKTSHILKIQGVRFDQLLGSPPSGSENETYFENYIPGALPQNDFVKKDNPEAVTVSIGGNDIGFADIVQSCVNPIRNFSENLGSNFTCYSSYEDRKEVMDNIDRQFTRLRSVYETLKDDGVKGRRVYVVGYPQVMKVDGNCGMNVQMNSDEVKFAHDLIAHLDSVIKRAADEAGVLYVDTEHAFDGHRLCEATGSQTAVNGITINKNAVGQIDLKASFHPNKLGHELLAAAVAEQTDNLTKPMPGAQPKTNSIAANPNDTIYQGAPKTGRPINQVMAADNLVKSNLAPLQPISLSVKAADYGTKPGGAYKLSIGSTTLGNYTADANGDLSLNAVVSAGIQPGFQTIHITGTDAYGVPIDVQQVVYVVAAPDDMDGDAISDANDSCILAVQSGQDADKDGIDDVCDPQITEPPATQPSEEGIVWWDKAILPITIESTTGP